ncbi:MAG: hypothetical protein HY587_07185 [Candidatus Omnitrophica bacterium]|nr:hypothetical protein [Candidatus Omnitrophota bacterium]
MRNLIHSMFLVILILCGAVTSYAAVLNVPEQYANLQEAINAASDGDTIMVDGGVYAGAVVTKSLEINGGGAIIDGSLSGLAAGFLLRGEGADGSKISHFTFRNLLFGIMINGVDDITISHNTMGDELLAQGITIGTLRGEGSKRSLVSHNVINDLQAAVAGFGGIAIVAARSENAMIKHNKIVTQDKVRRLNNGFIHGIAISASSGTMVSQNDVKMAFGSSLTNAVNIGSLSTGTVISFNDFRGTYYDLRDATNGSNLGPGAETTVQRNFSDGPEIPAVNRGEGSTAIRPSELLPHGNMVVEFSE